MNDASFRLASGGLVDRSRPVSFRFDGRPYGGVAGDTLASALLANGVRLVGRSFKYHRPRGILSAGSEEPNALVELGTGARRTPNTRATMIELFAGLEAASQNRFPSLAFDALAINGAFAPLLSAGFYYKTFMWPASFWEKVYEPIIRRAAGLGRAADDADPDAYEKASAFCDVLVIGAGPAGLAAALAAGRSGARVILCEEDFALGGRLLAERSTLTEWRRDAEAELRAMPELRVMTRCSVFGAYDGGTYGALERVTDHLAQPLAGGPRQRLWRIVARRTVLAAGATERPVVFDGNDRPGVMLAGSTRAYVNRFAVRAGRRAVVFAASDDAALTVRDLASAGVEVRAVVDARPDASGAVREAARQHGAALFAGATVTRGIGGHALRAVRIRHARGETVLRCDLLAMSGGWNPSLHLTTHHGARPAWNEPRICFVPDGAPAGMSVAGAANGTFGLASALAEGARCGAAAAADCGFTTAALDLPAVGDMAGAPARPLWRSPGAGATAFVDFQNDVTAKDVKLAHLEGFSAIEHLKRYTTLGMATDQGRIANVNGLALMAELTGRSIPQTGTTLIRPPVQPVSIGAFAGPHRGHEFRPTRLTPTHDWAAARGAVFTEAGDWLRAQWFVRPGDTHWRDSVDREVRAVRESAAFCDVTTLGKIDIQGPDAATLLDRIYVNGFSALKIGRVRYGLMLREDGFAFDDGTTARLGERHYLMTTTTANAGRVMAHLEYARQCLWPELEVQVTAVTEQWAQIAVAGPRSRAVLQDVLDPGFDLSNEAFPTMAAAETRLRRGTPARLFRISFSGELAYEVAVPTRHGAALADTLEALGVAPYGTEALGVLRIEKGHPAGPELNGQTTAHDLGFGRLLSTKKDFIGRAMGARPALTDPQRPRLVGVRPLEPGARLDAGAHLLPTGSPNTAAFDQGWITSAAVSPSLGTAVALAMLSGGDARHGEVLRAYDPVRGRDTPVRVQAPCFIDPDGERLRG